MLFFFRSLQPRFTKYEDMKIEIQLISKRNHPCGKSPYKSVYMLNNYSTYPYWSKSFHPEMFGKTPRAIAHLFEFGPPSVYFTCRVQKKVPRNWTNPTTGENMNINMCITYIYIMTYQESDQILSTNRFRHHDYDHGTEIANVEG